MQATAIPTFDIRQDFTRDLLRDLLRDGFIRSIQIANHKLDILIRDVYDARCHEEVWTSTVERTKGLDRIISTSIEAGFIDCDIPMEFTDSNGYDFLYCGQMIEHKNATSDGNSWTGLKTAGSGKVSLHLLTRMQLTGRRISGFFATFIDLSKCSDDTKWKFGKSDKASFSRLQIAVQDLPHAYTVCGDLVQTPRARKWLNPALESV